VPLIGWFHGTILISASVTRPARHGAEGEAGEALHSRINMRGSSRAWHRMAGEPLVPCSRQGTSRWRV
jgi:hypothetical protein